MGREVDVSCELDDPISIRLKEERSSPTAIGEDPALLIGALNDQVICSCPDSWTAVLRDLFLYCD
jgi:hypothetical protein